MKGNVFCGQPPFFWEAQICSVHNSCAGFLGLVNPARTGASRAADGSITLPSAISVSTADRSWRGFLRGKASPR